MELTPADFTGQTLKHAGTLVTVFLASWCPFCRRFRPAFETEMKANGIPWASVDLSDDENALWDIFNIKIVPTVLIFKDGQIAWRKDGVPGRGLSEDTVREVVDQNRLWMREN